MEVYVSIIYRGLKMQNVQIFTDVNTVYVIKLLLRLYR